MYTQCSICRYALGPNSSRKQPVGHKVRSDYAALIEFKIEEAQTHRGVVDWNASGFKQTLPHSFTNLKRILSSFCVFATVAKLTGGVVKSWVWRDGEFAAACRRVLWLYAMDKGGHKQRESRGWWQNKHIKRLGARCYSLANGSRGEKSWHEMTWTWFSIHKSRSSCLGHVMVESLNRFRRLYS